MAAASERGDAQRTFVVVDAADRWLGLAVAYRDEELEHRARLGAMWVRPQARGAGAAGRLVDACAEWARARGLRELRLGVFAANQAARRAYEHAGFVTREHTTWTRDEQTFAVAVMIREL
ncbi:MAG: GNAT family N-acetyltransferase [Actinomycetota bacterium]|nr:GNAT family N-acetyltransferase [Actinomycetota bacterium]